MFVAEGWMKREKDQAESFAMLGNGIYRLGQIKFPLLNKIIKDNDEFRKFMVIHSEFPYNEEEKHDWFVAYMSEALEYNDGDMKRWMKPEYVPDEILEQLKILDPEPIVKGVYEHIKVSIRPSSEWYALKIVDVDWEAASQPNISDVIKSYDVIRLNNL